MDANELKQRTKQFGLRVIHLVDSLPKMHSTEVIGKQLLRSGTSVGANYRSACRGKSRPDFIAKASIAIEEADESLYWMEMLVDAEIVAGERLVDLMHEADEIIAILTSSVKTARANLQNNQAKG